MRSSPPAAVRPGRLRRWWLDRSVRVKGTIVVVAPLVALTFSAVNSAAEYVMNDAVNAETGLRGYAATDDPLFLVGLHGDEVLRRLRAKATPAIIRHMRASGVIAYLTKPLDLTELGQLLDSFVAGHDHEAGPAPRTVPAS